MVWLNPAALFSLAAAAAPILIHLLVRPRADRLAFPTLRFLRPTRLASIRRHRLDDVLLLAVRIAILAAAAVALAGPLVLNAARRGVWNRRVVRAVVVQDGAPGPQPDVAPYLERVFAGPSLADGIRRAADWLAHAPPARRELRIVGPLAIGSIADGDLAVVPADAGVAFVRTGTLPPERTVRFGTVRTPDGVVAREVTLTRERTSVRDTASAVEAAPQMGIDIITPADAKSVVDAALTAVLAQRVWEAPAGRRVRLVLAGARVDIDAEQPAPAGQPWIADAIARLTRDIDLQDAAARSTGILTDGRLSHPPWTVAAAGVSGQPLVAAAAARDGLVVVSGAAANDVVTPILLRGIARATADVGDLTSSEVVAIPDGQLRAWSRPAGSAVPPRVEAIDEDDRRWLWIAALALLVVETWVRRSRRSSASSEQEAARVG